MAKDKETVEEEVVDHGSAFKRVDQTQGAYDDSALQETLAELGRSEAERVEAEKPER